MYFENKIQQQYCKYGNVYSLMQYITVETLEKAHNDMKSNKASGIDKVTKHQYEANLYQNLQSLVTRIKKGTYKPRPVLRKEIPKSNGKTRPLGIPCYEDKLVQAIFTEILNAIYEPLFLDYSCGYRPNRNCHTALSQLNKAIHTGTKYIVDCDIKGFFNNLNHLKLIELLELTIKDRHFIRYIYSFLTSGVMIDGKTQATEVGTPQGGLISPVLANIYLHYCLDLWFEKNVKSVNAKLVRYCDDFIVCFNSKRDALSFLNAVEQRLLEFRLNLQKEKTRIVKFDITDNTSENFNFLGFNIYIKNREVMFVTSLSKSDSKCQKITDIISSSVDISYHQLIANLNQYLQGIYNYYGVFTNQIFLDSIYHHTISELNSIVDAGSGVNEPAGSTFNKAIEEYPICKPPTTLIDL